MTDAGRAVLNMGMFPHLLSLPISPTCILNPPPNPLQGTEFADSSGPLFSMYQRMTKEEDDEMAERWQKDAKGIIIFVSPLAFFITFHMPRTKSQTGLFSAAVAVLVAVSVLDLKQNPQDTSAFYLQKIYELQVLVDSNAPRSSIPSTPAQPDPFSPPTYSIWVNSLWFVSLVISLTCAMLATLLQQWARRYLKITHRSRGSPHEQARIRAFFAEGVNTLHLSWVVEALPTMIQISVFLFFAGLLIYLFNVDPTVFKAVVWSIAVSIAAYLSITLMPLRRRDSPYYTPLSSILWNMDKLAKKVEEQASDLDGRVLKWIFDTPFEDHKLVQFFENIPGFYRSSVVSKSLDSLSLLVNDKLPRAVKDLLDRTWSSDFVSDSDKMQRLIVCVKLTDEVRLPDAALSILKDIFPWDRHKVLRSVEIGQSLRTKGNTPHQRIGLCAQSIVAGIITDVQGNDDSWVALAADQLNKQEDDIRRYLANGDNVELANLIHIAREIFHSSLGDDRDMADASSYILPSLSNFNILQTLPELQQEFRDFWGEVDLEISTSGNRNEFAIDIRDKLRDLHNTLSRDTHNASTTPPPADTNSNRHPPDSSAPMDGAVDDENAHTHTTPSPPVSHHDASRTAVPGRNTPNPADGLSSPDDFTDGMRPITEAAAPPHSISEPLEALNLPSASRDIANTDDETQRMTADISSRDRPNPRPNPSRSFRADSHSRFDSAMVSSEYLAHPLESSSPASTSAPSPATPRVASQLPP